MDRFRRKDFVEGSVYGDLPESAKPVQVTHPFNLGSSCPPSWNQSPRLLSLSRFQRDYPSHPKCNPHGIHDASLFNHRLQKIKFIKQTCPLCHLEIPSTAWVHYIVARPLLHSWSTGIIRNFTWQRWINTRFHKNPYQWYPEVHNLPLFQDGLSPMAHWICCSSLQFYSTFQTDNESEDLRVRHASLRKWALWGM